MSSVSPGPTAGSRTDLTVYRVVAGNITIGLADKTRLGLAYCPWLTVHAPNSTSLTCVLALARPTISLTTGDNS
jgi:hypothetical protein